MKTALVWRRLGLALTLSLGIIGASSSAMADDVAGNGIPNIFYNAATGALTVNPDNAQLISIIVSGPAATSINRWGNGTNGDGVTGWAQQYFNGAEQWVGAGGAVSGEYVSPVNSTYQIATYATGLTAADFGQVEIGAQDPANPNVGGLILFTDVSFDIPESVCDFDGDGDCDADDATMLTRAGNLVTGVAVTGANSQFDLNGDNTINQADLTVFLADAATENGWNEPYYLGDTDLNGKVDFGDFVNMNNNWQSTTLGNGELVGWRFGDFNGDNNVNFNDFVAQNNNWQRMNTPAGAAAAAVPEPTGLMLGALGLLGLAIRRRS